jgi:hypothetical protein
MIMVAALVMIIDFVALIVGIMVLLDKIFLKMSEER